MDGACSKIIKNTYEDMAGATLNDLPKTNIIDSERDMPKLKEWEKSCEHYLIFLAETDDLFVYHDIPYDDYLAVVKQTEIILGHTRSNFFNMDHSVDIVKFKYNNNNYTLDRNGLSVELISFDNEE